MIEVKDGSINLLEFLEILRKLENKIERMEGKIKELESQRWDLHRYVEKQVIEGIEDKLQEIIEFIKGE